MDFDDLSVRETALRIAAAFADVGITGATLRRLDLSVPGAIRIDITLHASPPSLHEPDAEHIIDG